MTAIMLPDVREYRSGIARALEYAGGTHTVDDVIAAVDRGDMQCWPIGTETVLITQLVRHPQFTEAYVFLAAGRAADLEAAQTALAQWAREQGCRRATFVGRKGWLRSFLTRTGWRDTGLVMLTKEL